MKRIGIVGLGLIGGSFSKALKESGKYEVFAYDKDISVLHYAKLTHDIDGELNRDTLKTCDMLILAVYPRAVINYLLENAEYINKDTLVVDAAGTKQTVCKECFKIAKQHGFTFCGGHPMAGTQFSGYKYSRASLFSGAVMILTPEKNENLHVLDRLKEVFLDCGFAKINVTDPKTHDEQIAYTSQLPHVVSNAYIKSPRALNQKGFSAGSFRDLSRVARLNEDMWTQLFMENRDALIEEIDVITDNLKKYRDALDNCDADTLKELLKEGRILKERTLQREKN